MIDALAVRILACPARASRAAIGGIGAIVLTTATSLRLGIHRRSLQRKLQKIPPTR